MLKHTAQQLKNGTAALSMAAALTFGADTMAATEPATLALPQQTVSLAGAELAVNAALAEARENGWVITVAVVDNSGELVALARDDNAIAISPSVAIGKAKTAALLRKPSKAFEDYINDHNKPSFLATPGVTPLEGGVPLFLKDGSFIGAVGVSGAHGPNDTQVAEVAAKALADQ